MDADGADQTNLTNDPADDFAPAWSPDGTMIAFTRSSGGDAEIYVMNADGTGQTNLTNNPDADEVSPAWSPDGSKIAYASQTGTSAGEIYAMNADGSGQTNLTNDPADDSRRRGRPTAAGSPSAASTTTWQPMCT